MSKFDLRLWLARLFIAAVIIWNLQAALAFLLTPHAFTAAFELDGVAGQAAIRGTAVLFVMWNVPYLVACWQPRKQRISLWEAFIMQCVGVFGETLILLSLPSAHATLSGSLTRFIIFDAAGILLIGAALILSKSPKH